MTQKINFEILVDDFFKNLTNNHALQPIGNKFVLSFINDFENGEWRHSKFQNFIWDNIAETALSDQERKSLLGQNHSTLVAAAKQLRLEADGKGAKSKGSEVAEILLYGIMRHHYHSLPIVPKIFYKQNNQDYAKGADSVHIVIENQNDFSIWFGEAKFYKSIEDARLDKVIESVGESLDINKLRKENSIITNVSDIDLLVEDASLRAKIKKLLSPDTSIDELKPKLHIPIMLLHECSITKGTTEISKDYKDKIIDYHKKRAEAYYRKQIAKLANSIHKYSKITFHLILFPVPDKKDIVSKFVASAKYYRNQ